MYSTFLGGSNWDEGYGIAVDSNGNAYITGFTGGLTGYNDFPTTQNAYQPNNPSNNGPYDMFNGHDAFVAILNPTGFGQTLSSGSPVTVSVPVTLPSGGTMTVTFDNITTSGILSVAETTCNPVTNFTFLGTCYEITFTGQYTGSIHITIPYEEPTGIDESTLAIYHGADDCTDHINYSPNPDTINNKITGTVTSLSDFGVGYASTVSVGAWPWAVAVNPVTDKIYVVNRNTNNVTVINGSDNSTTTVSVASLLSL